PPYELPSSPSLRLRSRVPCQLEATDCGSQSLPPSPEAYTPRCLERSLFASTTPAPICLTNTASSAELRSTELVGDRDLLAGARPSYKRSVLVALRATKIQASDPPSASWPGSDEIMMRERR